MTTNNESQDTQTENTDTSKGVINETLEGTAKVASNTVKKTADIAADTIDETAKVTGSAVDHTTGFIRDVATAGARLFNKIFPNTKK